MFLYFVILTMSPILNLGPLSLLYLLFDFTSTSFILIVLWYVLLYLLTISSNLRIYTFFYIEVTYLKISFFKVLINLYATIDSFSLCFEFISMPFFLVMISLICYKSHCLYLPRFCLVCNKIILKFFEKH